MTVSAPDGKRRKATGAGSESPSAELSHGNGIAWQAGGRMTWRSMFGRSAAILTVCGSIFGSGYINRNGTPAQQAAVEAHRVSATLDAILDQERTQTNMLRELREDVRAGTATRRPARRNQAQPDPAIYSDSGLDRRLPLAPGQQPPEF